MSSDNKFWSATHYVRHSYVKRKCQRCGIKRRWRGESSCWEYLVNAAWTTANPVCIRRHVLKPAELCGECGKAEFQPVDWLGRQWVYRSKSCIVSESIVLDTCPSCGAVRTSTANVLLMDRMFASQCVGKMVEP